MKYNVLYKKISEPLDEEEKVVCSHSHGRDSNQCRSCALRNRKGKYLWSKKSRENRLGKKNPNWHGNNVTYIQLHVWIKSRLKKPSHCPNCHLECFKLDLCNKGKYDRNLENWEWLCRRCHMKKDGRLQIMKQVGHQKKVWNSYKKR